MARLPGPRMRVVAGSARGRALVAPAGLTTRPTTDRVREAVFNALHSLGALDGADVLDASRAAARSASRRCRADAEHVTFVDTDPAARRAIEANLVDTGRGRTR